MFQFSGFPSIHYGFMYGSQVLHLRGFPIRKSADRSLFAAPRSLSQLVTSFVGSWCQGIHLMLFLAWTSSSFSSLIKSFSLVCLSLANNWLGYILLFLEKTIYYFRLFWRSVVFVTQLTERPYLIIADPESFDSIKSFSIICSFLTLLLFGFQWTFFRLSDTNLFRGLSPQSDQPYPTIACGRCPLVGLSGLEPPTSRLSGARSNLLSYKPMC